MTTYARSQSRVYRKIYEQHHGPIPQDDQGRTYDIHHIDGDPSNNDISNLLAVSIQDHLQIHLNQGDWAAAMRLMSRLGMSKEEKSKIAKLSAKKRIANGTHPFIGERNPVYKMLANGTHPFVGGEHARQRVKNGANPFQGGEHVKKANKRRIKDGTHNFLGGDLQRKRVEEGTHHLLGGEVHRRLVAEGRHNFLGGEISRKTNQKRMMEGTHNILRVYECPHCNKLGKGPAMFRYHFSQCKKLAPPFTP